MKTRTHRLFSRPSRRGAAAIRSVVAIEAVETRRLMSATLDPSFGPAGTVDYRDANGASYISTLGATTADNKVVTVTELDSAESVLVVRRFNEDGSADLSFDFDGVAEITLPIADGGIVNATDVVVSGNEIYVAGEYVDPTVNRSVGFVAHVTAAGTLDASYAPTLNGEESATPGLFIIDSATLDYPVGVDSVEVDSPLLAVGQGGALFVGYTVLDAAAQLDNVAGVTQLDATGTPFAPFGVDGTAFNTITGDVGLLGDLFVDGGGVTLVGDTFADGAAEHSAFFAQLSADGTLDLTLDADTETPDGFKTTVIGSNGYFFAGAAQGADGKIIIGGSEVSGDSATGYTASFTRFTSDFDLDLAFGVAGTFALAGSDSTQLPTNASQRPGAVDVDAAGFVYGVGSTADADAHTSSLALIRLTPEGTLDGDVVHVPAALAGFTVSVDGADRAVVTGIGFDADASVVYATVSRFLPAAVAPTNDAPVVTSVTGPATTNVGSPATFTATFADDDAGDTFYVSWDFGDGTVTPFVLVTSTTATISHTYTTPGGRTVTFTVKDAAGASASGTTLITAVAVPPPPYTLAGGKLTVAGTAGDDTIVVTKSATGQTVLTYGPTSYTFAAGAVTGISIDGAAGNDFIRVSSAFTTRTTLIGGAGNDTLRGANGDDLILGGDGNDVLIGRDGDDILVGGEGADLIIGREDDDILISGTTSLSMAQLAQVQAEWTSSHNILVRVANISGLLPLPGRLNGNSYLILGSTVFNDNSVDTLAGGDGTDIYVVTLLGSNRDVVNDRLTSFAAPIAALVNGD